MSAGEKSCKLQGYRAVSEANFKSWGILLTDDRRVI